VTKVAPVFSVVVPVYNRAHLIERAVRSVLNQTYSDFEIIVVDDGSTDDSAGAAEHLGDSRIHVVRRENGGASAARNTGMDAARGRYVAFLDSDDTFLPHHLDAMRLLLDNTSGTAAYAPVLVDRGNGKTFVKPPRAIQSDQSMAAYLMCDRGFVQTSTLVVPTDVAQRVRYRQDTRYGDDTDFAIRLHLAGCRFVMAGSPGAVWRDQYDPKRLSAGRKGHESTQWLEDLRPHVPEDAYFGYRGWHVAKGLASSDPLGALRLYFTALRHGSYSPKLAATVLLQIFCPDWLYRRIADCFISVRHWSAR
jgi:glycosyltransferase involved in cell wall biosynthesis